MRIGLWNDLVVKRRTDNGLYLEDPDENEVLLPNKYTADYEIGDDIRVFIYHDSEERLTATTRKPLIMLNGYAGLEVVEETSFGVFVDWGLEKNLFIPKVEEVVPLRQGNFYVVYMYLDEKSNRLVGTTKINKTFNYHAEDVMLTIGQEVELLPYRASEMGYSCVVWNRYQGLLFQNEVFQEIEMGKPLTGYVKKIREDGKIDLHLNKFGYRSVDANVKKVIDALESNNGTLNLHDKSDPVEISQRLGMSKKVFKKAIGALYKEGIIKIKDDGIELI
ncbi:MAG: S1-like domain-containing RNA-binding protein [Flavobacteriales bacterium]|nr:S1-like domain-containing RNA-binding protein [Flavobacteriales bacterium]